MKTREELEAMKARDIMKYGTTLGIKGMWDMKKADAISAILFVEKVNSENAEEKNERIVETECPTDSKKKKEDYVNGIEVGVLVAFRTREKVISAKVKKRSTPNRRLLVETQYGAEYKISFDDVIWVKTGKRWPRGVYNLLKGVVNNDEHDTAKN